MVALLTFGQIESDRYNAKQRDEEQFGVTHCATLLFTRKNEPAGSQADPNWINQNIDYTSYWRPGRTDSFVVPFLICFQKSC
jgi:hypothetical protein